MTADLAAGQTVLVRATIRDCRMFNEYGLGLKPQEAATAWHEVQIITNKPRSINAGGARPAGVDLQDFEKQVRPPETG